MKQLILAFAFATTLATSGTASAQVYPSRPITMVVSFAAGGPLDVIGRSIAEPMQVALGQPVTIENFTGANGSIGVGRGARAAGDGYTLVVGAWNTHVVNGAIYPLQYHVLKDFEPIALLSSNPILIVARNSMPANDLNGLVGWLKANPDKATAGTAGAGSPQHVAGVFFQQVTDTRFQFVPYRGGNLAMQDLLAGQTDIILANPIDVLPLMRAGRIKVYAVASKSRLASAPEIPTVDEAGMPGFYFSNWFALWAPKGTPKDVIGKLNSTVVKALADPNVRRRLADHGHEIFPREQQTPEALATFHKAEIEKWWPIIKSVNIKGE